MKSPFVAVVCLVGFAIAFSHPSVAQGFEGELEITVYSLRDDDLLDQTEDNLESIMSVPVDAVAATPGVEVYVSTMKVRGTVVHTTMEMGEMMVDYAANRFWMYNPHNDTHATWTGDEFQEMMSSMMGGPPGQLPPGGDPTGAMAMAMAQMQQAQGNVAVEAEGPYSLNRSEDCGEWWGGHMGTVSLDDDPMQEGWVLHTCVSQDHADAWRSMKAMAEAYAQLDMEGEEDAEAAMEAAILEHGLPTITRRLQKGGGFSPSIDFELAVTSITPGPVSADEVAVKGSEVPLQEFIERMMEGGPPR